jgi:very-short-patch-repair endonuclease
MTGKHHSEKTKQKISEGHKGIIPWNKGKCLPPISDEHKKKISEAIKGDKHPFYGKHHSEESKKRMSEAHKGHISWNKGKHLSEKTKKKLSDIRKGKYKGENNSHWKGGKIEIICEICGKKGYTSRSNIANGYGKLCSKRCAGIQSMKKQKKSDTDIERLFEDALIRRDIPYTKQVPLLGITLVDFLLPHDTVIYVDGSYWHSKSEIKIRDNNQISVLTSYGYKVFRFTDTEIKKSVNECIDKIILDEGV